MAWQHSDDVVWTVLDGEAVLYDGENLHRLNPTASSVWLAIDGPSTAESIVAALADLFAESAVEIRTGVAMAIADFAQLGLLVETGAD